MGPVKLVVPELKSGPLRRVPSVRWISNWLPGRRLKTPYALTAKVLGEPGQGARIAVDDRMWAVKAIELRRAMPELNNSLPVLCCRNCGCANLRPK